MDLDTNRSLIAAALARIPGGDQAALQTVYRLTSAKLFGVALRILGERSEAEDVLQEVYVTVWRKAADFDAARASPMTWLIAIARNRAIDRLRASGKTPPHGADRAPRPTSRTLVPPPKARSPARKAMRACTAAWTAWRRTSRPRCAAPFSTATPMRNYPSA